MRIRARNDPVNPILHKESPRTTGCGVSSRISSICICSSSRDTTSFTIKLFLHHSLSPGGRILGPTPDGISFAKTLDYRHGLFTPRLHPREIIPTKGWGLASRPASPTPPLFMLSTWRVGPRIFEFVESSFCQSGSRMTPSPPRVPPSSSSSSLRFKISPVIVVVSIVIILPVRTLRRGGRNRIARRPSRPRR